MQKPDDIPQDVWDAATECFQFPKEASVEAVSVVAGAIMADRRRIVLVANSLADDIQQSADELRGNMRDFRLHRVAGIRHLVSIIVNPLAFAERAAAAEAADV